MKYLLIFLYFIFSAGTVNANAKALSVGDVFSCQMEAFVQWDWEKTELTGYQKEQFNYFDKLYFSLNSLCESLESILIPTTLAFNFLISEKLIYSDSLKPRDYLKAESIGKEL